MTKPWQTFNFYFSNSASHQPLIAISACLHGEAVRYDGTDKQLEQLSTLKQQARLQTICPEVGAGMSTPRPPIQLQSNSGQIIAIGRDDPSLDMTQALKTYAPQSVASIKQQLNGYIFKARSPSCGINSTPLFNQQGDVIASTSGIQAAYIQQEIPWLPLRDERQLLSNEDCQQFIFHCLIIHDLVQSSEHELLAAANQHYHPLISRFSLITQQELSHLSRQPPLVEGYLTLFSQALAALQLADFKNQK